MPWKELFSKKKYITGESISNMESSKEQEIKPEKKEESYDVNFYVENLLKFRKVYDEIEEGQTYYRIELREYGYEYLKNIDCKEIKIVEKYPIQQIENQFKQFAKDKWIDNIPFAKSDIGQIHIKYEYGHYRSYLYKEKIDFFPAEIKTIDSIRNIDLIASKDSIVSHIMSYLVASVKLGVHSQTDINSIITQQVINKARKSLVGDVIWIPPYDKQYLHKLINGYLLMIDEKPALIYTEDELDRLEIKE